MCFIDFMQNENYHIPHIVSHLHGFQCFLLFIEIINQDYNYLQSVYKIKNFQALIFQLMEFPDQKHRLHQKTCTNCTKKQELIQKYQNLITLLKKKADKSHLSHLSLSQKLSFADKTTSYASFNVNNKNSLFLLPILLHKMEKNLQHTVFNKIKLESCLKKYALGHKFLLKVNELFIRKKAKYFKVLKEQIQICQQNRQSLQQICIEDESALQKGELNGHYKIDRTMAKSKQLFQIDKNSPLFKKSGLNQSQNCEYKSLMQIAEDHFASINLSQQRTIKQQSLPLLFSKKQSSHLSQIKNLYKKVFTLQQQTFTYQQKIKHLQFNMQQALNRQIKQNRKKTQSLQMVAQEMAEKNQLIVELQEKITMLQQRYDCQSNGVLEDQLTQHRKQVEKLEKVNIKLDNDLRKVREKLVESEESCKKIENQKQKIKAQSNGLKHELFQLQRKMDQNKGKQQKFKKTCLKINKILERLKAHEKIHVKVISPKQKMDHFNTDERTELEQLYKLELVFMYLYNIEDEHCNLSEYGNAFDQEQTQVLKQLRSKIKQLKNKFDKQADLMQSIQHQNCHQGISNISQNHISPITQEKHLDNENIFCPQGLADGSIFQVLNQNRHPSYFKSQQQYSKASQRMQPEKNFTMKLLQMEIQKNKQIQKISQLKEKYMYIRNIILNLLKSLQLKQNFLKTETLGILQLIFDVFEYSQEEKQTIFHHQVKQKRFFGFI